MGLWKICELTSAAPTLRKENDMSAFLGPIHYWLYGKIEHQEKWIETLIATAGESGWGSHWQEKLETAFGKAELKPLEESIDHGNIHGWLQERIHLSERRLAFLVTALLKEDASRLALLMQATRDFGESRTLENSATPGGAFKALTDSLLDGMPCDHVNKVMEEDENKIIWQQARCLHRTYWDEVGGDITVYYALRAQIIIGMLAKTQLVFAEQGNGLFEIKRR